MSSAENGRQPSWLSDDEWQMLQYAAPWFCERFTGSDEYDRAGLSEVAASLLAELGVPQRPTPRNETPHG